MMNNLLKSKLLFLGWLIIVSTAGCNSANIKGTPANHETTPPADDMTKPSDKGGVRDLVPVSRRTFSKREKSKSRLCWTNMSEGRVFILAMGSNMGDTEAKRLKWANKDAEHFADAMHKLFGLRDKSRVCVLDNVTKAEFVQALKRLSNQYLVNPDDLVIIFYSGHGTLGQDDENGEEIDGHDEFFVPYSEQEFDIESWLRDDDFSKLIKNINTNNILMFIDACYSAGLSKGDEEASELVKRLDNPKLGHERPPFGATLDPVKGVLLSAAMESQKAVELNGWCVQTKKREKYRGGRFTVFFLEALKRAKKPVDLLKVFEETRRKVKKHSVRCSETTQEPVKKGDDELFHRINGYISLKK